MRIEVSVPEIWKERGKLPARTTRGCSAPYHHPMPDCHFAGRWSMFATPSLPGSE